MIDIASARTDGDAPAAAPKGGASSGRTAGATGGTRRPRESAAPTAAAARSGAGKGSAKGSKSSESGRAAGASTRRGSRRGAAEEEAESEAGGRPRYERKKDNSPMVLMVVIGAMAVVAAVMFFVFANKGDTPTQADNTKTAEASADKAAAEKAAADKALAEKAAAEGAGAADGSTADPGAAGVAEAAAKPAKKPVKKPAEPATPVEIKDPSEVYQPSSDLEKLPQPAGLSDAEVKVIEELIETVKTGSGMPAIRAKRTLATKGIQAAPLIANTLIGLDYTKPEANQVAFELSEIVRVGMGTDFPLGFQPVRVGEELDLNLAHANALNVKRLRYMAETYWHSEEGMKKFRAKYAKGGDKADDQ